MSFFKNLGIFNMLTAKNGAEFGLGALTYLAQAEKEEIIENNKICAEEWIEIIEDLEIAEDKKKLAISYCNRLKRAYKPNDVNYIVRQINKLTGCNFE